MHRHSLRKTAARSEATNEAPRPPPESESSLSPRIPDAELRSDDPGAGATPTRASRSYRDVAALDETARAPRPRREEAVRFDAAPPDERYPSVQTMRAKELKKNSMMPLPHHFREITVRKRLILRRT